MKLVILKIFFIRKHLSHSSELSGSTEKLKLIKMDKSLKIQVICKCLNLDVDINSVKDDCVIRTIAKLDPPLPQESMTHFYLQAVSNKN